MATDNKNMVSNGRGGTVPKWMAEMTSGGGGSSSASSTSSNTAKAFAPAGTPAGDGSNKVSNGRGGTVPTWMLDYGSYNTRRPVQGSVAPETVVPIKSAFDFDTDTTSLKKNSAALKQWDTWMAELYDDAERLSQRYTGTGLESDFLAAQNAAAKYQSEYGRYSSSLTAYQQSVDDYRQRYAGKLSLQEGDFSMATADDAAYFRDSYQKQLEAKQQELADAKKQLGSVMSNTGVIFSPAGVVYAPNQTRSKETDALEQEIAQLQGVVNYYSDVAERMSEEGFDKSRRDWIERGYDLDDQYSRFVENKKTAGTYTYRGERKALEKESRDLHLRLDGLDGRGAVSEAERTEITQRLTEINEELSALPRASKEVQDDKAAARADDVYTRLTSGYGGLLAAYSDKSNGANRDSFVSELEAESRNAAKRWAELTAGTTMAGIGAGSTVADFRDAAEKDFKTLQKQTRAMGGKANAVGEVPVAVVESATAQLVRGVAGVEKMVRDSGAVDYTNISSAPLDALLDFVDDANEHLAEVMTGMSPVEQKLTELGVATVAAIPAAVLAAKTAGLSTASEGVVLFGGESAFWNAVGTATSVLKSQVTNPMFWDSFIQAVGNGYLNALDMGVDFSTASSFALINGYINSYIEIGGGIQTLPKSLRELNETISMDQVIKKYLTSMYEEGLEEVHQGFTERLLQNMLLDADNPGFSMTDPDAVISVYGALEEFMGGAVVSAVLGGAQSFNSFAEAHGVQEVVQRLNTARMTLPEQMRPDALVYTNKTTLAECQDYFTEMLAASIEEQAALINKEKHIPLGKYLSQRKDQRLEKVFTAIEKANKGNTSILAPFASEMLEKYGDNIPPQVAIEQGELLARIFDGKYLTDEQLDRLDFDSNIVLELFLRKAGIEYNPRLYDPSDPTMKARIVKSVVDGVNEVRANQAELKAATKQAAEQTAAEVKARTEEHTAEEKVDKSKKLAKGEKERRELAEVAKYEREQPMKVDGLTKEQVFDIIRNRLDGDAAKDLVDKAAFADRWVASERLRVNTRDLDTTQLGRIDAAYERYLADLGLTKAEINAINEVTRDDLAAYKKAAMEKSPVKAKVEVKTEEPAEAPEKETVDERRADDTRGTDAGGRGVDPRLQEDNGGPEGVAGSPERVSEPGREDRVDAAPPRDDVAGGSGVGEAGLPDMAEVSEAAGASPEVRAEVPVDGSADGRGPGGAGKEDRVQEPGGDAGVRNEAPLESPAGGDGSQRRVSLKDLGVRNTTLFEDGEHYTEYEFGSDNADPRYERYAVAASLVRSVANSMGVTNVHFLLSDNGTFYDVDGNHAGAFTDRARRGAGTVLVLLNPANDSTYLQNPIRDAIHELIHALPAGIRRTVVNNALKDMTKEHEARILKLDRYADYAKQGADWKEEFVCDALSMLPMSMQITRFHPAVVESLVGRLPNAIETLDSLYDALESMADMPVPAEARVKPDEYRQLIEDARDDLAALRDERRHGRPTEEESAEMDKVLDVFKTQSQEEKAETPKKPGLLDDFNNLLSDLKAGAETEPEAEESAPAEVPGNPQEEEAPVEESPEEMRERTRPEPPEPVEAPTPVPGVTEAEVEEIKEDVRKTETAKQEKKTKRKKAKVEANTKTIVAANPAPAIETAEAPVPVQSIQQAVVRANNPPIPSSVNTAPSAGASMRTVGRLFPAGMTWTSERMDSTDTATVTTIRLFQGDTPVYTEEARYPKGRTQLPTAVGSSEDVRARLAKGSPAEQEVDRGDRENDMRTRNRGDGESIIPELEAKAVRDRMETEIQRAIKKAKVDENSPEAAAIRAQIEYDFRHLPTKMIAPTSPVGQLSDAERQRIIKAIEKSKDGEYKYGKTVYTLDNDGRLVATVDMSYLEGGTTSTDTGEDVSAVRAELMRNGNTPVERTVSTGDGVFRTRVYQLRDYTDPITGKTAPRLFATERYTFVEQTRDEQSGAKVRGREPVVIKTGNYHIDYAHPENSVRDPVAEARDEKLRGLLTRARGLAAAWPGMKERQVAAEDVPISAGRTASGALTSSVDKARQYNEMYNKAYPWFVEALATVQELYPNDMDMQRAVGSLANMVLMGYADTDTYSRVINALHDQGDTGKQIRAALKQAWARKPIAGSSESAWKTALDNQLDGFRTAFPGLTFDTQSKNRLPKEFFSYAKVLQSKGTAVRPAGDLSWRPHLESKPGSMITSADTSVLGDVLSLVQDNATQTMEASAELREAESRLADAEAALYDAYDAEYADLLKREYQGDLPEGRADELAREGITDLSAIQEYYSRLTDVAGLNDQLQSAIDLAMESVQAYVEAVGVKGQEGWLDVVDSLSRSILTGEIDAESALEAIVEASNSLNADLANANAARSTIVYDVTSRAKNLYRKKRLSRQHMTVSRESLTEIEQKKADERAAKAEDGGLASSKIPLVREYESKIKDWNSIPGSLEADLHEAAQARGDAVKALEQTIAEIRRLVDAEEIPPSVVGMLDRLGLNISSAVETDLDVEQVLNGIQYVSDRMFDALVDQVDQQINEAGNDPTEHPAMNALGQLYLDYENYINADAEQDSLYRTAQYAKRRQVNLVGLDEALNAYMSDREAADWDEYDENERIRRNEEARAESLESLSEGLASDNGGVDEGLPTEETDSWLDERADTARYDWESGAPVAFSLPVTQTDIDVLKRVNSEEYQTGLETDIVAAVAEANPGSTENSMTESASTKEKRLEAQRRKMAKEEQALPVSEQATAIARGYYDADGNHIPVDRPLSKAQSDAQSMNDDELLRAFKKQNEEASKRSPTLESPTMEDMSLGAVLSDAVHSAYRHAINEYESIDRLSKKQTSAVTATHLVKAVQNANTVAGNIAKTNLISHDGDIIGRSLFDVIFCWEPDPNRKDHQIVNERKQDAFNEYLFLQHHIDRMQVAQKAEDRVSSYYLDHAWLLDLTPEEAANLAQEGNEVVLELVRRVQYRNRVRESQAKGELSKEVLADPEYPERALPVDKALERIRVLENEYQDFADKADAYYKWYDIFMREWAVGTSITEYGYQIMHEMYPHYVPTNRTAMTEVDAAVKRLRMWLNDHPEFRTITNEEAMIRAQGGDAAARKYIELRVAIEESENVIKLGNRPVGGGSFSASDNAMASGKATNEATGSLRTLIPVQDQLLSEVRRLVKMRSTNDLLVNLTKEALFDTDGSIFGRFLTFDNSFTDTALQRDIAAVTDEDIDSLITIEGTGKNADYYIIPWLNGQRMRARVSKGVYQGLVFITNQTATDPTQEWLRDIQKVGRTVGGVAKQMITGINPSFFLRNPMRDFQTAMANSVAGASFPKYWLQAVNEMSISSENWLDFYNMGGTNSGMLGNMYQRRLLQPDRKRTAQELATDEASVRERILNAISKPGEYTEELTRFAEYLATIDPARPSVQGLSPAQLRLIGIKNAAEVTVDFTRAGSLGKTLNSFVLYFNPQIQGLDKAIRTVTEQPGYKRLAKLGQLALINGLPVLLGQALLKAMGRWDDWNKLSDYIKANYFCIPVSEDGRRWLRIPRSRDWGQVFGVLTYRLFEEQPWDRENGREGVLDNYFTTSIQANLTPPGIGSAVGLGAIWDIRGNADYAGNAIVPYNLEDKSKHLQFDEDSSWQSVAIAQLADKLGAELSPKQLDYIVKSFCGDFYYSLYRFIPATLFVEEYDGEVTWVWPKGEEIKETAAASGKSFVDQVVVGAWITDSWKSNQTTTNYYNTLEKLETRRQDEGREGSKHDAIYDALMNNNGIGKQIQQIAKEIRDLPKGKERDALYIQRNAMMMDAMQFIKDCEDGTIADPVFYAMYHSYGGKIESEAKNLNAYAEDYDFAPTFSRVSYISDPDQKGYRFDLKGKTDEETEEIKDTYVAYCQQEYSKVVLQTMANDEYRDGDSLTKAILLSMAKDQAILNAKEDLAADLRRMGMQSRKSTDNENAVEEKNAKYAFSRMLGESKLSRTTTDEIIRLYDYTEAYAFMPSTYVPSEYTDPDNKRNKYDLSDSDKDQYKSIRDQVTNRVYEIIVTDPAYQALDNDAYKARLLAAARDECTTISRKLMLQWLAENGQSVPKKTEEDVAEEKIDKYFSQMAVSILKQHGITY